MKVESARLQQAVDGLEIRRVIGDPDVLEHADRGDLVEIALDQRIVAQLDRHLVLESEARDLFLRIGELLLGERHADARRRHNVWRRDRRARPSRSRCRAGDRRASGAACGRSCRACRAARSRDRCSSRGNRRSCRPSRDRERAHRTRWKDRSGSGRFPCWLLRSRRCAPRGREWPRAATVRRAARTGISVRSSAPDACRDVCGSPWSAVSGWRARKSKITPLRMSIRAVTQRLRNVSAFGRRSIAATTPSSAKAMASASGGRSAGTVEPSHSTKPKSSDRSSRTWASSRLKLSSRRAALPFAGAVMCGCRRQRYKSIYRSRHLPWHGRRSRIIASRVAHSAIV